MNFRKENLDTSTSDNRNMCEKGEKGGRRRNEKEVKIERK